MNETVKKLLEQILPLSEMERLQIADGIWESLGEELQDELWEENGMRNPEYRAMLEERMKDAEEHPERVIPGDEAFRQMREHLAQQQVAHAS
jgi:hypothetical protein